MRHIGLREQDAVPLEKTLEQLAMAADIALNPLHVCSAVTVRRLDHYRPVIPRKDGADVLNGPAERRRRYRYARGAQSPHQQQLALGRHVNVGRMHYRWPPKAAEEYENLFVGSPTVRP
jgi:hypothetical protein